MPKPLLKELDKLSIWDFSHYWYGVNPQKISAPKLLLDVQKSNKWVSDALGNIDLKQQKRREAYPNKRTLGIAKYISKSYLEQHQFNRKRH